MNSFIIDGLFCDAANITECGVAWCVVWCGVWRGVWCGVAWCVVWCGLVCGVVWCGTLGCLVNSEVVRIRKEHESGPVSYIGDMASA